MERKIVLDKNSFMALASENRITVLKNLDERKMTVSELSKRMDLSKPALLKHLKKLVEAGLIKKIDDERKWVYYSLTNRGKNVLHPDRVKITLLLSSSIVSLIAAIAMLWQYIASKVDKIIFYDKLGTGYEYSGSYGDSVNVTLMEAQLRAYTQDVESSIDYYSTIITYNESYIQLGFIFAIAAAILCLVCIKIMYQHKKI